MEKTAIKLVIFGGSAGSLDALLKILPRFERELSFAIAIVMHRKSGEDTTLEELISFKTSLQVNETEDKTEMLPGHIYIAPADYHLLFEKNGVLSLDASEKINFSRPSIDVSFESAADAYGQAVAAILLSGANADGTEGLKAIQNAGGIIAVQSPETAEIPFMPQHALTNIPAVKVIRVTEIADFIMSFSHP
jgi:two-component system chemotaxis response regulator CheB